jgi:hypothetical protein
MAAAIAFWLDPEHDDKMNEAVNNAQAVARTARRRRFTSRL